jgi:hypothetical protein
MKILAIEKEVPNLKVNEIQSLLKDEALAVWNLYQDGIIREIYFRADQSNAVLILECETVMEAEETLSKLPLVNNSIIKFDLIPLKPYSGFSRLF